MPVAVAAVSAPLAADLLQDLQRVYADYPVFASADDALAVLQQGLAAGGTLYTGLFNARHIASVLVVGEGEVRGMRYLSVHQATRGRGVAERLVAEVRRLEAGRGAHWLEADFDLSQEGIPEMLLSLGFIPHGDNNYRCRLQD